MSNTQILNIGIPIAIGFAIILAIGYGKTLHNDINTKPKPKLTARVDLSDVRNNLKEIEEDLSIMTVQVEEGVKKIDKIEKIEKSLQSIRSLNPESLKELIEELETDNLAGAKKKLKHKKSKKRK